MVLERISPDPMIASRSQPPRSPQSRAAAPLNSVSTRIVLCVFCSTLLTALIVSWLSIGAIHADVRSRVDQSLSALSHERATWIESWHAHVSSQLDSVAAVGTPWHDELVTALDRARATERTSLHWLSGDERSQASGGPADRALDLPAPPPLLAEHLERLTLRATASSAPNGPANEVGTLDCLSVHSAIRLGPDRTVGMLEGCLDQETLLEFLTPPPESRDCRMALRNARGRIVAAAGLRAAKRVGETIPLELLSDAGDGTQPDYDDSDGVRVVGASAALGSTGWSVITEAEHDRAFAHASEITSQILVVDICVILLFTVLAYKITLAIMKPIETLSEGAERIAAGQVDHQIPVPVHDDELSLLTRAFNEMMRKLRSNQLEIEEDRFRLAEKNEELQRVNEILSQLSITDGLTKLHNHRYFQDHLSREIKRVSRTHAPLSMILLDIDDFKQLNDTHGHAAGDEVLTALAAIMNDTARESDLIARYGGEEFVILMPNTDLEGALHLAEKLRMAVESTRLIIGDRMKPIDITISLGVATYEGERREFFGEADRALYQAKANGKNCVVAARSDGASPRAPA